MAIGTFLRVLCARSKDGMGQKEQASPCLFLRGTMDGKI
jgi:hypothetical protein